MNVNGTNYSISPEDMVYEIVDGTVGKCIGTLEEDADKNLSITPLDE
jgi:hypothetical protein